jgi:hypothetical protein
VPKNCNCELLTHIKELKNEKQFNHKFQQGNQYLKKKLDKNLLEKDDEISRLKDHSQKLLAQIKSQRIRR